MYCEIFFISCLLDDVFNKIIVSSLSTSLVLYLAAIGQR